jgi:hypothetical protein
MTTSLTRVAALDRLLSSLAAEICSRHRNLVRELRIEVRDGGVILSGKATCFFGKQIAFHEFARLAPLAVVANLIEVEYDAGA